MKNKLQQDNLDHPRVPSIQDIVLKIAEERSIIVDWETFEITRIAAEQYYRKQMEDFDICVDEEVKEATSTLESKIKEKDKQIKMYKNDLLDMLDLKNGNGPTALSILINELKEKDAVIERLNKWINDVKKI